MSDCQSLGDCADSRIVRLYEYLDGALSVEDIHDIKVHLDSCVDCAKEHDIECVIRSVVKRSCQDHAPADLKSRIMGRITEIHAETPA
ncbi:mycothiol system anti-sigma-R factor [Neomicrococcus aestuarii]|jgi:anti-sigma factor (TIGR02949 family)|uniref:Anti-sigma factor (TIGR02949 family) n=1 Tax=Neomicrococcus aestuarii TaxID=556325 RepID=A0A1L2ZKW7_9MICC|nr:mycothiol system anti-sigma-R factor [Neomicrococcus aestuarii]APF39837.1 mycothiol system anti-sigma-R factor [Neomicrococcus aestuarii]MBB5513886.1 anti-sigma factor (TIGR02949 family) [Neomicrococcus aestuarii]